LLDRRDEVAGRLVDVVEPPHECGPSSVVLGIGLLGRRQEVGIGERREPTVEDSDDVVLADVERLRVVDEVGRQRPGLGDTAAISWADRWTPTIWSELARSPTASASPTSPRCTTSSASARHADFPQPIAIIGQNRIWLLSEVNAWAVVAGRVPRQR
jgi:hypothetical protein